LSSFNLFKKQGLSQTRLCIGYSSADKHVKVKVGISRRDKRKKTTRKEVEKVFPKFLDKLPHKNNSSK